MAIALKGMSSLMNKINNLSEVKAQAAVEKVAKTVENELREAAGQFSDSGYRHIGKADERQYPNGSYFVEIGLKNDSAPWEQWKHLYFHHYGYNQFFMGNPTGKFTNMHQFWFTNAVDNMENGALKELKEELRKEIREALR